MKYLCFILAILFVFSLVGFSISFSSVIDFFSRGNIISSLGNSIFSLFLDKDTFDDTVDSTVFSKSNLYYVEVNTRLICYEALGQLHDFDYLNEGLKIKPEDLFCIACYSESFIREPFWMETEKAVWEYYAYTYLPTWLDEVASDVYVDVPAVLFFLEKYCFFDKDSYRESADPHTYLTFDWNAFKFDFYYLKNYSGFLNFWGVDDVWYLYDSEETYLSFLQMRIDLLLNSDLLLNVDLDAFLAKQRSPTRVDEYLHKGTINYFKYRLTYDDHDPSNDIDTFWLPPQLLFKVEDTHTIGMNWFNLDEHVKVIPEFCIYEYSFVKDKYANNLYAFFGFSNDKYIDIGG